MRQLSRNHGPDVLIIVGLASVLSGVYLLWDLPVMLILAGAVSTAYGTLLDLRCSRDS